ncbi:MAG: HAD hydrolase family protein [Halofilum sp. (in: g-proteobacteria)]
MVHETKDAVLESLATMESIDIEETIVVGDGANDVPML